MRQETALPVLTPETQRTIAGVDGNFFIVQADGTIRDRNDYGKSTRWVFELASTARRHALRNLGARVWDKAAGVFL